MTLEANLVLIGPAASGKSTLGKILADELEVQFVDLDEVSAPYYEEVGWSIPRLVERIELVGRVAAEREWEVARAHAVSRALTDFNNAVIAFGAGHSSFSQAQYAHQVAEALRQVAHVVFVEPCEDRAKSLQILRNRSVASKNTDWIRESHDFLAQWLDDPLARRLATTTLHTDGDSPLQSAQRLLAELHLASAPPYDS
ncbi:hypothetical protein AUR04nite_22760 [Glutamicibacter uratoxydans]|uniref:Shikimate kinase n=1 Tax=Glutamicibacter uratoxydans TaxID=43667 RepID=A0A4Y4DS61_GLUUR|nr:shikimate kinase [Glutamicibacter uratoxydans]GED06744.1 hypothetical protein AUR04nite_22760 [Glutamicibacter uratoxydans]